MQVADQQQLHPAKRQFTAPMAAENAVDPIKQIGPHHADFIDHQQVEAFDDIDLLAGETVAAALLVSSGKKRAERKLEKGVQGNATGIDCRHPGGGGNDQAFAGGGFDPMQESGFSGAGLSGKKDIASGISDKFFGQLQVRVGGYHHGSVAQTTQLFVDFGNLPDPEGAGIK